MAARVWPLSAALLKAGDCIQAIPAPPGAPIPAVAPSASLWPYFQAIQPPYSRGTSLNSTTAASAGASMQPILPHARPPLSRASSQHLQSTNAHPSTYSALLTQRLTSPFPPPKPPNTHRLWRPIPQLLHRSRAGVLQRRLQQLRCVAPEVRQTPGRPRGRHMQQAISCCCCMPLR